MKRSSVWYVRVSISYASKLYGQYVNSRAHLFPLPLLPPPPLRSKCAIDAFVEMNEKIIECIASTMVTKSPIQIYRHATQLCTKYYFLDFFFIFAVLNKVKCARKTCTRFIHTQTHSEKKQKNAWVNSNRTNRTFAVSKILHTHWAIARHLDWLFFLFYLNEKKNVFVIFYDRCGRIRQTRSDDKPY